MDSHILHIERSGAGLKQPTAANVVCVPIVNEASCEALQIEIEKRRVPVLIQMDEQRWAWSNGQTDRDLVQIIKAGEFDALVAHLAGTVIARRFTMYDGLTFDAEFFAAAEAAERAEAPLVCVDRDQTATCQRAWRNTAWASRWGLFFWFLHGLLRAPFRLVNESRSANDVLASERTRFDALTASDAYVEETAQWIRRAIADRDDEEVIVLVRPHVFESLISSKEVSEDLSHIASAPKKSLVSRALPWVFTSLIISAFVLGFVYGDFEKMEHAVWAWVLINGTLAGVGATLAGGHFVTVLATAVSAPLVSLNPAVGAGMVGALVQALVRPPTLSDLQNVGDAIAKLGGWWSNRLARVILIFFLANAFSTVGSFTALAWFPAF